MSRGVPFSAIEHVGSTSVPGLAAKPVIDCDIVVLATDVPRASQALVDLGFAPMGELGISERWAFREPDRLANAHVYVVVEGSLSLRNHLAVRDVLRTDSSLCSRYAAVKKSVAHTAGDIDEYGAGKNDVLQAILAAAGLTEDERQSIDYANRVSTRSEFPQDS